MCENRGRMVLLANHSHGIADNLSSFDLGREYALFSLVVREI